MISIVLSARIWQCNNNEIINIQTKHNTYNAACMPAFNIQLTII